MIFSTPKECFHKNISKFLHLLVEFAVMSGLSYSYNQVKSAVQSAAPTIQIS